MDTAGQEQLGGVPLFLEQVMLKKGARGGVERVNQSAEYTTQYGLIGLFFCEPHDLTSRMWGSIVTSLTHSYAE